MKRSEAVQIIADNLPGNEPHMRTQLASIILGYLEDAGLKPPKYSKLVEREQIYMPDDIDPNITWGKVWEFVPMEGWEPETLKDTDKKESL